MKSCTLAVMMNDHMLVLATSSNAKHSRDVSSGLLLQLLHILLDLCLDHHDQHFAVSAATCISSAPLAVVHT